MNTLQSFTDQEIYELKTDNHFIGVKVYHHNYGQGTIKKVLSYYGDKALQVQFNSTTEIFKYNGKQVTETKPTLSLTPYDFVSGGFTPLSDIIKPKVGDYGYFWDDEKEMMVVFGKLTLIRNGNTPYTLQVEDEILEYKNFSLTPPTHLENEILKSWK